MGEELSENLGSALPCSISNIRLIIVTSILGVFNVFDDVITATII